MKKTMLSTIAAIMAMSMLTGCADKKETITVISREEGSGTRDAFVEIMGILENDTDRTVGTAEISSSTSVVIQSVAGNANGIGYISLGSLNDDVKAVSVDGVAATAENVSSGSYKVSRPFNIATKDDLSPLAADFVTFILSAEGQAIIEEEGYISIADGDAYTSAGLEGTIVIAGSTSVAPVMEVLADEYKTINSGVTIEIQQTGSSAGMTSTIEGACDIGMASREVKESELAEGLTSTTIAMDGIAVIVNKDNSVDNLTSDQILNIYTGTVTEWSEVK